MEGTNNRIYSDEKVFTISPYIAVPTNVKAVAAADGSITVTWSAVKIPGVDQNDIFYRVFRTTSSYRTYDEDSGAYAYGTSESMHNWKANSSYKMGYTDEGVYIWETKLVDRPLYFTRTDGTQALYNDGITYEPSAPKAGVTYYYYVQAYRRFKSGNVIFSGYSKAASAVCTEKKPAKPVISKVTAKEGKTIISWKTASKARGYLVYRSTKKSSGYKQIARLDKVNKYEDTTTIAGTTYYYKIKSIGVTEVGAHIYSAASAAKKVKAK
jgi:hypothetical protein